MKAKNIISILIVLVLFLPVLTMGCGPKNPVDKGLDKLELTIEKWEKSGVVSSSDIVTFQREIMEVTDHDLTPLMNTKDWTPRRQARYHKLQERGSKLLFSTNH